jgi:protein-disulfide isomerase
MKDKLVPVLVVAIIVAAFAVGLLYGKVSVYEKSGTAAGTAQPGTDDAPAQQPAEEEPVLADDQWKELISAKAPTLGKDSAKVTMVEFTDYQCPFCSRYINDSFVQIKKDYIDTGKIRYMQFDLPLPFHTNAKPAALAARCSGDQNKYWEMHDVLFEKQTDWESGDAKEKFAGYASEIGLNASTFAQCYDSGKYNEAIDEDLALAQKVGASGTPTFFINGERLVGAQPISAFTAVLDKQLN